MTKEAMELALEALKESQTNNDGLEYWDRNKNAIKALEEALKQEQDEPVAWEYEEYRHAIHGQMEWFPEVEFVQPPNEPTLFRKIKPLYTTPQPSKPLTDERIEDLYFDGFSISKLKDFARAIESAHGIKE